MGVVFMEKKSGVALIDVPTTNVVVGLVPPFGLELPYAANSILNNHSAVFFIYVVRGVTHA
jgi:hypothetical protein